MATSSTESTRLSDRHGAAAVAVSMVADDLTGAADASVPFVLSGYGATVLIDPESVDSVSTATVGHVRAVSLNSRGLGPDAARRAVRAGVTALGPGSAAADVRFKKIDSTLRGHVAAETLEALIGWDCTRAIIAPAFPELGRTVTDGRLALHGVESGDSASAMFEREAFASVITVSESAITSGVLRHIADASATQSRVALVCDSTRPDTLDHIVRALWDFRRDTLWVGSAGLARALARAVTPPQGLLISTPDPRRRSGGCVFFIGSTHHVTTKQCAELEAAGETSVGVSAAGQDQAAAALSRGRDVLVRIRNDSPEQLAAMVKVLAALNPAGLVLSGGDTAVRVCQAANVTALRLLGEVDTGVPWGNCIGGEFHGVPVVLKSGGFGQADTLLRVSRFLTRQEDGR